MKKSIIFILFFYSCKTNELINNSVKAEQVYGVSYFPSIAYISQINRGNKGEYNEVFSNNVASNLDNLIKVNKRLEATSKIELESSTLNNKVKISLLNLFSEIQNKKNIKGFKIPDVLDSIISKRNERFTCSIFATGFERSQSNYNNQVGKSIGVGILSLGTAIPVPIKGSLQLKLILIDKKTKEVIYYKNINPMQVSPTDRENIKIALRHLLYNYFYSTNQISF